MRLLRNQRGISLLQASLALLIGGLVIAGLWILIAEVNLNSNLTRTERGLQITIANIRDFYRDRPINDAAAFTNANLQALGLIAPELLFNGVPAHAVGTAGSGNVTFGIVPAVCDPPPQPGFGPPPGFAMGLENVSRRGCAALVTRLYGSTRTAASYAITRFAVNQTVITPGGTPPCVDNNTLILCLAQN